MVNDVMAEAPPSACDLGFRARPLDPDALTCERSLWCRSDGGGAWTERRSIEGSAEPTTSPDAGGDVRPLLDLARCRRGCASSAGVQFGLRDRMLLFPLLKPDADEERC
jgi:hypothetical protein